VRILPDVMNDRASIKSAEVVKQARIPAVLRIRAKPHSYEVAIEINFAFHRVRLPDKASQVVAIEGEGECSEVAVAEYGAVQLIEGLVIETFCDIPSRVPQRTVDAQDCAGNGIPVNPVREGITGGSAVGQR